MIKLIAMQSCFFGYLSWTGGIPGASVHALTPSVPSNRRQFLVTTVASSMAAFPNLAVAGSNAQSSIRYGDESIMQPKAHGTSENAVQDNLLYGADVKLADRICNYNRHFAERAGYFINTEWPDQVLAAKEPITYYDSVTGLPLFRAPIGRSKEDFLRESEVHGWPSFRDEEVVWENVRVLQNSGETVSATGSKSHPLFQTPRYST